VQHPFAVNEFPDLERLPARVHHTVSLLLRQTDHTPGELVGDRDLTGRRDQIAARYDRT
jgi:hypothetical protein